MSPPLCNRHPPQRPPSCAGATPTAPSRRIRTTPPFIAITAISVNGVFQPEEMDSVVRDIERDESFFAAVDQGAPGTSTAACRRARCCASWTIGTPIATLCSRWRDLRLIDLLERFIGPGVSVYFGQIFFKPAEGGGPKLAPQDNFYFGPADPEGMVTAWIALDDATLETGTLLGRRHEHRPGLPALRARGRALQPPDPARHPGTP